LAAAVYAFDGETLGLLWNDKIGNLAHWVPPTIADGKVFVAATLCATGKILAYDLCQPGIRDCAGTTTAIRPPLQTCEGCHPHLKPWLEPIGDEARGIESVHGSMTWGWQEGILNMLSPPSGQVRSLAFEATGEQVYEARPDPNSPGRLIWQLKEGTSELVETRDAQPQNTRGPIRVHLAGSIWSASDGSSVGGRA
jgi:hypothetical protein